MRSVILVFLATVLVRAHFEMVMDSSDFKGQMYMGTCYQGYAINAITGGTVGQCIPNGGHSARLSSVQSVPLIRWEIVLMCHQSPISEPLVGRPLRHRISVVPTPRFPPSFIFFASSSHSHVHSLSFLALFILMAADNVDQHSAGAVAFLKDIFSNPTFVSNYGKGIGPRAAVPGFSTLHRMIAQLMSEKIPARAKILVLGAGGGVELAAFAALRPEWRFVGSDPSELMIDAAREATRDHADRIELHTGYIPEAPAGPYDGATCLMTLHCVPDNAAGDKLNALRAIRERLVPGSGAPFVVVDQCIDRHDPKAELMMARHLGFMHESDPTVHVPGMAEKLRDTNIMVSPAREEALLAEAGFTDTYLFFAGLAWRGWITYA